TKQGTLFARVADGLRIACAVRVPTFHLGRLYAGPKTTLPRTNITVTRVCNRGLGLSRNLFPRTAPPFCDDLDSKGVNTVWTTCFPLRDPLVTPGQGALRA